MRNQTLLFIALVLLILISLSGAYAENSDTNTLQNNSSIEIPNQNSTSTDSSEEMKETVINGTVNDCKTKNPFPGVNITVRDNSKLIASTITKADGTYYLSFLSNHTNFNVTASHVGHYSVTKEVTVSFLNDSSQYGTINFQLGATIYVNEVTGEDSYDGTNPIHTGGSVGPKKTINGALKISQPGGSISIAAGTYTGSDNRHLIINIDLAIFGSGANGTGNTTLDAGHNDLFFIIERSANVTIANLTLQNGEAHDTLNGHDGDPGGAIFINGTLTVQNCNFFNNRARNGDSPGTGSGIGKGGDGGAIYNNGTLTIQNCYLKSNYCGNGGDATPSTDAKDGGNGGAICSLGALTIEQCTFEANYAGDGGDNPGVPASWGASGGSGGAVYIHNGTVNITDSTFSGNYGGNGHHGGNAGNAGGIYNNGTLTLQNSNFTSNFAGNGGSTKDQKPGQDGGHGGALYNEKNTSIDNCTFNRNYAGNGGNAGDKKGGNGGNGGAIYNTANTNITDSTFDGNYAGEGSDASSSNDASDGGNGGAIYTHGNLSISDSEIKNNKAGKAGSAYAELDGGNGGHGGAIYNINILNVINCTIHNNNATNGSNAATTGSIPGNGGCGGGIFNNGTSNVYNSNITANYAGKGGDGCSNKDGKQGGNGGGIYNIYILTLQNCILNNNYAGQGGLYSGDQNGGNGGDGGAIYNNYSLSIQTCNIYNNKAGNGGDASDYFQSFSNAGDGGNGGGIYNEGNLIILPVSNIYDNTAGNGGDGHHSGDGGYGGGIYSYGTLNLTGNSTNPIQIYSNIAGNGGEPDSSDDGGDYGKGGMAGAIYNKGNSTIEYASIYSNTGGRGEFGGNGGAIYNTGNLTIEESTIRDNKVIFNCKSGVPDGSGGNGGGIYNTGHLTLTTCQITNNQAGNGPNGQDASWKKDQYYYPGTDGCTGGSGGGIYNTGTLSISESSVNNNSAGNGGNGGKGEACYNDDGGWGGVSTLDPGNGGNGGNGGGIFNSGNIVSISNTTINNNQAGNGGAGGLYNDDISALEHLYQVTPGTAGIGGNGGGIYSPGNLTSIQNTTIDNNQAGNGGNGSPVSRYPAENGNTGGNGGGIVIYNSIMITNCQISNNKAGNGGNGGNTAISGYYSSTEPGNGGNAGYGGGIYLFINDNSQHTLTISNCTLDNNSAGNGGAPGYDSSASGNGGNGGNGGGIVITRPTAVTDVRLTIEESTITHNQVGNGHAGINGGTTGINGVGGGLYSFDGQYSVSLCRIVDNAPQAMYLNLTSTSDPVFLTNNWWGSNSGPIGNVTGSNILASYYNPWLILTINATPTNLYSNQTSNVNASIIMNSNGINTLDFYGYDYWLPDGIPVTFGSENGTMSPPNNFTDIGSSSSIFTPNGGSRNTTVSATVDYQTVTITLDITGIANTVLSQTGSYIKDVVTFIVTASNNGPDNATEVNIVDLIPAGLSNVIVSPSLGEYNITSGVWFIPILVTGSNATLNITGTALLNTMINNTANKTSQVEFDPVTPDISKFSIYIGSVDLYLQNYPWWYNSETKSYQYQYVCGNTPVITADIENIGPDDASGTMAEYIIPSGLKLEGYSVETGTVTVNGNKLIWNIGYMPKGGRLYLKIFTRVIETGNQTPNLTTQFNLTHTDQNDTNATNNNASCPLIANPSSDIGLNMTQELYTDNGTQYVRYRITVVNNGPNNSTGVQIKDILPSGVEWVSDTSNGAYNHDKTGSGASIWNIGKFNYGDAPKILEIVAKVTDTGTIKNTATKLNSSGYDWNTNNNAMSTVINPQTSNVNLCLQNYPWWYNSETKSYQYQYVCGNTPVFTADIQNIGPDDASGVIAEYIIPSGLKLEGYSVATSNVSISDNKLIWNIGYMPKGGRLYLKIFTRVIETGNQTPNLTTQFNLTHTDQNDTNATNNNASCPLIANPSSDIGLNMTQELYTENNTQYIKYIITVVNNGPDNSTGVQIKDILPSAVEWVSDTSSGSYNHSTGGSEAGIWNIGSFVSGNSPQTLEIIARVIENGVIKNTASKYNASGYDWNNDNNAMSIIIAIPV